MPFPVSRTLAVLGLCVIVASGCATAQSPTRTQADSEEAMQKAEEMTASSDSSSYVVYTGDGTPASLDDVVAAAETVSVVFVGETHDDPGAHALQLDLLRRLAGRAEDQGATDTTGSRSLALSMEMFERDVQSVVDEYLAGLITERHFVDDARAWSNYTEAYRPLVEFARSRDLDVLAANAPRRYVNRVFREGPASLQAVPHARKWLAPLPYPGPSSAYQAKWNDLMRRSMPPGHGQDEKEKDDGEDADSSAASPHRSAHGASHRSSEPSNMLHAQALWDATMAHTIAKYHIRHPKTQVLHLTGAFHVSRGSGTPDALRHYLPVVRHMIVLVQPASNPDVFTPEEHEGLGDFVVLTPASNVPSQSVRMGRSAN